MAKTKSEIVQSMIQAMQSLDSSFSTEIGSPNRDIVIDVPAEELADLYLEIEAVATKQSIAFPEKLTLQNMVDYAANWGITRKSGTKATVTVYFQTSTEPTADIRIDAGKRVSTLADPVAGTAAVEFKTIEAKLLPYNRRDSYFNSSSGLWEIPVQCQAVEAGVSGNVATGKIVVLVDPITGVDAVENKAPASGGTDAESKALLAQRVIDSYVGGDKSTPTGILAAVESLSGVEAALVVTAGDSEMKRAGLLGNAVDVFVRGSDLRTVTDSFVYDPSTPKLIFTEQPVYSIDSVTDDSGNSYTEGSQYQLVKDTSDYSGSRQAQDAIVFITGQEPAEGAVVSVTYSYNSLIKTVQSLFAQTENDIVNLDILVREPVLVYVVVEMKVKLSTGIGASVLAVLESLVTEYLNALPMGQDVEQSDVITLVQSYETSGAVAVDKVYLPLIEFRRSTELAGTAHDIAIADREYVKVLSISIHE